MAEGRVAYLVGMMDVAMAESTEVQKVDMMVWRKAASMAESSAPMMAVSKAVKKAGNLVYSMAACLAE